MVSQKPPSRSRKALAIEPDGAMEEALCLNLYPNLGTSGPRFGVSQGVSQIPPSSPSGLRHALNQPTLPPPTRPTPECAFVDRATGQQPLSRCHYPNSLSAPSLWRELPARAPSYIAGASIKQSAALEVDRRPGAAWQGSAGRSTVTCRSPRGWRAARRRGARRPRAHTPRMPHTPTRMIPPPNNSPHRHQR
jgi:hypothetical protein